MDTVKITFNDGTIHEYIKGTSYYDISKDYNMENIMGFKIQNEIFTLDRKANRDEKIEFINTNDTVGNKIYRSGLKYIFQVALAELYPNFTIHYEHSVPKGVLGEVYGDKVLIHEDIINIKRKMDEIINQNIMIQKINVSAKEAIKYYESIGEIEKASNINDISDKVVTLYKLKNHLNYFFSAMPYSTGLVNKYELVYLGNNRIVFLFPTPSTNGKVPEYVHYDKIIESFLEGTRWLKMIGVPYITNLNQKIGNNEVRNFVKSCEIHFNICISKIVKEIIERKDVKFILIAGPSSSGKTTTTRRLNSYFTALGYHPIQISLDDYFLDREKSPRDENGNYDFECVEALNIDRFNHDLNALLNGEKVMLPRYNFITGKSEETDNVVEMTKDSIFLIEGLHAINDSLTEAVDSKYKYKIYLSPFIPINIDKHNYISTLDLRLIRRIVRDYRTRGWNVEDTINSWSIVRHGEDKYIFPFIHQADAIINTALAYELNVLKVYVEPLLLSVRPESKNYEEARRLIDSLKHYWTIPSECVDSDSILREFIGGLDD